MTQGPFPPFPPGAPFAGSETSSIAPFNEPDFPRSAGGRELGKFRPSTTPRLTQIAVTNDDGTPIGFVNTRELLGAIDDSSLYMKAVVAGLARLLNIDPDELLDDAADL